MSFFKQLRLLLHHKILLRRRQPTTLALELFWPTLVFVAVLLVRLQFPPENRKTCYYNSKALPSAGSVNFWQSLVCNIDNPCINSSAYQHIPQYPNAKIHHMVEQLSPLLTDKNVTSVIRDLPKGIRLIAATVETLSQPPVKATLESGLPLRDILRESGAKQLREFLHQTLQHSVDSNSLNDTIEILVNSSVNIVKLSLLSKSSSKPLREVICEPRILGEYILIDSHTQLAQLSESICLLDKTELQSLLQLIQDELDFVRILDRLLNVMQYAGLNDFIVHIKNIAAMIDTIDKTNVFASVNALLNSSWASDVPKLIRGFRSGEIEMKTLLKIASDIEPLFRQIDSYNAISDSIRAQKLALFYENDDNDMTSGYDLFDNHNNNDQIIDRFDFEKSDESSVVYNSVRHTTSNHAKRHLIGDENRILPKLITHMDQFIDGLEIFANSNRWKPFMRVFAGIETVFEILSQRKRASLATTAAHYANVETVLRSLPERVKSLTAALNHLFPANWHLLPWANQALHQIIDSMVTGLRDAFTRSASSGALANSHHLPEMVHVLLMSLEKGTFPRRCPDWSRAVCDKREFVSTFQLPVANLDSVQNLSCIFFGSEMPAKNTPIPAQKELPSSDLLWSQTSAKLLDIYLMSKKTASESVWEQIFNFTTDVWHSQSIPDKIIFAARIVQLLADCYIPDHVLSSSFWKEVYKYKSVANEILNIVIDEINHSAETETLAIEQISLGSPTLAEVLHRFVALLPDLTRTLTRTLVEDMPQFIERLAFTDSHLVANIPCNGASFADLFPSLEPNRSAVLELERILCEQKAFNGKEGDTSDGNILDELMANPRTAAIVMVLQSRSTEPHDVHMFLPQFDWVEAALSIASIKESVQRVLSLENGVRLFPEIAEFDQRMRHTFRESRAAIEAIPKRGVPLVIAYLADIAMPLTLRFFALDRPFAVTCDNPFSYIEDVVGEERVSTQWQCVVVALKFAAWSTNHLMTMVNSVLENFIKAKYASKSIVEDNTVVEEKCAIVDGTLPRLIENIPIAADILVNSLLINNEISLKRTHSLRDLICSPDTSSVHYPFVSEKNRVYQRQKSVMCSLFDMKAIKSCRELFMTDEWSKSLRALNDTWFRASPLELNASMTQSLSHAHQLLSLFGQFRPISFNKMSDKLLNGNNWWYDTLNDVNSNLRAYQRKKFVYAAQTLAPILRKQMSNSTIRTREALIALSFGVNALTETFISKNTGNANNAHMDALLKWADNYLLVFSETVMQTLALDATKLAKLFQNRYSAKIIWRSLCNSPVGRYFIIDNNLSMMASLGKESLCDINFANIYNQWLALGNETLRDYSDNQIVTIFLTKTGELLDTLLFKTHSNRYKFLESGEWKPVFDKINRLTSQTNQSKSWIYESIAKVVRAVYNDRFTGTVANVTSGLSCGLSSVKSGVNWETVPQLYRNRSDALSLYNAINSGFTVSSIAINTFLVQKKFQNFLDLIIKPKNGLKTFCSMRGDSQFQRILAMPSTMDHANTINEIQNLLCKRSASLIRHINPVSNCFTDEQLNQNSSTTLEKSLATLHAEVLNAIKSAKHFTESDIVPPLLDKSHWSQFSKWWSDQVEPHPKSSLTLVVMRAFQLLDSLSSEHVIWKAVYRTVFELSETVAYILRALQIRGKTTTTSTGDYRNNLFVSTVANLMFPEVNDFISLRTFKQLRWIKLVSKYYALSPHKLEDTCATIALSHSDRELSEMTVLFCRHHPSEWIYSANMALNKVTVDMRAKVNYITQSLNSFVTNANTNVSDLRRFVKQRQIESIESVAGTAVVFALATNHIVKQMTFAEIVNTSWHTVPIIIDSVDKYICASTLEKGTFAIPDYRPKPPDIKTMVCELPVWNFTQAYYWLSDHLDFKNTLNLIATSNGTAVHQCVTPLKFISQWLQIAQVVIDQLSSSAVRTELRQCYAQMRRESLWQHSLRYVRFVNGVLSMINKLNTENSWPVVRQIWNTMSYYILNQIPAYVPIANIIKQDIVFPVHHNNYSSPDGINHTLTSSNSAKSALAVSILTSSSLNVNAIAWKNFSSVALQHMICGKTGQRNFDEQTKLPVIVTDRYLPLDAQQESTLFEYLCGDNRRLDYLIETIDTEKIDSQLPDIQREELSKGDWLEKVAVRVQSVTPQFTNIYNLGFNINSGKSGSIVSLIQLTRIDTLDAVIHKLHYVIERLAPTLGDGGPIIEAFAQIMQGLQSLRELSRKGMFEIRYRFRDLIKNVEAVEVFMEYHLGLEPIAIQTILNSSIDFTEHVARGEIDSNLLCNRTQLFEILSIPRNEFGEEIAPLDIASHAICTLSIAENYRFTNQILKQLAVRKIIGNFVKIIADGVLVKAHLTNTDIPLALHGLKAAAKAMPYVKGFVSNFSSSLDLDEELDKLDLNGDGIELLGSPQASVILGKLMCGHSLPALSKEMQLMRVSVRKPHVNDDELGALASHFCQHGYRSIMKMQGGAVIWAFLKQILAGKVLYTPKNHITDAIMSQMNSTFTFMSGFVDILQAWAQTISSLETFYRHPKATQRIKSVQHLIVQFLGDDVEGLFDDIDTVHLIERLAKAGGILGLVQLIGNIAQCVHLNRFVGVNSELELERHARVLTKSHEFVAGIVFVNLNDSAVLATKTLPKNIEYKIRIDIDFVPTTKALKARIWEPGPRDNYLTDLGYFKGFVEIQEMIDRAITSMLMNGSALAFEPAVHMQQFPYLCYEIDKFGNYIRALSPLITTIAWIFLISYLIRERVLEKELHLEEVLRVMGLKPGVAWMTWFLMGLAVMAFGNVCGLGILKLGGLIPNSDIVLLYLFFMSFCLSLLMYCYLMSSFFKTATIASLSGIVAYLASFLPFMVAITLENEMNYVHKVFTCLSMSTSFCYGMMYMSRFEVQGVGIQWTNLWHSPMQSDTMNVGTAIVMMLFDSLLYFLLAWYISHVRPPGNNALRYPWYFFLTATYWGCVKKSFADDVSEDDNDHNPSETNYRTKHSGGNKRMNAGMELRGLYVIYNKTRKSKHVAVSNLNLTLKEGQITTLLGRNGAGKTTTINVLTGQLPPTAGSVYIYGHPVPEEFMQARKLLGYCPQYNTLFKEMTVREHLKFYSRLKELLDDEEEIDDDINNMLHSTGLWHLQHHLVKHLSGGLQRRLCVALAFVGGSKLIILDEPTASVDPVARRSIWDLIVQQKQSRTVLLTTHHMDEAEILSDQVAVIHRGKLLCIGSPLLLRSKYGCGYQLTVSRQGTDEGDNDSGRSSNGPSDEQCDIKRLMAFAKCLIPNASLVEDYGGEVVLALPQHDSYGTSHDYATFFRCLDANINALGFGSYGLTSTTLEEVFLTLCSLEESNMPMEAAKLAVARKLSHPLCSDEDDTTADIAMMRLDSSVHSLDWTCPQLVTGPRLKMKQLWALLRKRFTHTCRDWRSLFCTLFLPCIFIAFAMGMTLIKPTFAPDPALPLMPSIYGASTISFYSLSSNSSSISSSSNSESNSQLSAVSNQLLNAKAVTADCLRPRDQWKTSKCPAMRQNSANEANFLPDHLRTLSGNSWRTNAALCKCDECATDMSSMAAVVTTPIETAHGFAYDLSGVDVNRFLLRTYPEFMDRRWGGWSYHHRPDNNNSDNPVSISGDNTVIKVWFDNNGYHAMPAYLNALNNAIMRANLVSAGVANATDYNIITYSHPLHIRSSQVGDQSIMQRAGDAGIALIILVGFIFIPTSFVFYIVRERTFEEKQLQRIFGVGTVLYWVSALIWDLMSLIVAVAFSAAIISSFQLPIYMARLNLPAVLTLLFLFGWAMITLVYLMEKLFNEASIAFMVIYCLALFIGINTMVTRLLIDVFKLIEVSPTFQATFDKFAMIFPPYVLLSGLVDIHRNQIFSDIFTLFDQDTYVNPFSSEMLANHYITLAVEGVVLFFANLAVELFIFSSRKSGNNNSGSGSNSNSSNGSKKLAKSVSNACNEDSDVTEERRKVHLSDNSNNSDILKVIGVSKAFQSMFGKKIAVDNVSFSVPKGECFGLLGVNGAGKTTLFRILTGQLKPTTGQAVINGKDIRTALSNNNQSIGYCPQADALDFVLTPHEHLTIYAHMRGIPTQHIPTIVNESMAKYQLMSYTRVPVFALSRGNRRKLCLAIAMLGNPQIALLDEPTSGLDPQSRRYICQNIQNAIRDRRSVLLTSHSMEECDILCSRLAIMVNGRFKCIGSPQYLKHKFGSGYLITLRLSEAENNCNDAITYMNNCFTSCVLRAHHHTMLEFGLPNNGIPLSSIFENLQSAQQTLRLQDFSVSQTTLDQVFVSFASQQVNDYQSPLPSNPSKSNSMYSNPGFVSSREQLNSSCRPTTKSGNYSMRPINASNNAMMRLRDGGRQGRITVTASNKLSNWSVNENITQF